MKKSAYIIGFFVLSLVFTVAYYGFYRYASVHLKSDNIRLQADDYEENPVLSQEESTALVHVSGDPVITSKTLCITEYYDEETGETTSSEGVFTPEYFGMDRVKYLDTLEENAMLLSFNEQQVAVRVVKKKEETPQPEDYSYYLILENNKVSVYKSDKTTLYFDSTIRQDTLTNQELAELTQGKYIKDVNELYGFLESHTS